MRRKTNLAKAPNDKTRLMLLGVALLVVLIYSIVLGFVGY
jgi:hypothetical protein